MEALVCLTGSQGFLAGPQFETTQGQRPLSLPGNCKASSPVCSCHSLPCILLSTQHPEGAFTNESNHTGILPTPSKPSHSFPWAHSDRMQSPGLAHQPTSRVWPRPQLSRLISLCSPLASSLFLKVASCSCPRALAFAAPYGVGGECTSALSHGSLPSLSSHSNITSAETSSLNPCPTQQPHPSLSTLVCFLGL